MDTPVAVVGLMGAGKSTLSRALGSRLSRPVRDSDEDLETATGRTAAEIADYEGMQRLHDMESHVLADAVSGRPPVVVAAAASTVEHPIGRGALAAAFTVWIDADVEVLVDRFTSRVGRPQEGPDVAAMLRAQDARRRPLLAGVADVVVDATAPTQRQVTAVLAAMGR